MLDLAELTRDLCARPVHLVGMSLGGLIAAEFAFRTQALVKSLAVIDVAPGVSFPATAKMRDFIGRARTVESVEAAVEAALRVSPQSDRDRVAYRMHTLLRQRDDGAWEWKHDGRREVDFSQILARVDALRAGAAQFDRAFLMVRGQRSQILSHEAARDFARRFPAGRCVEVADAGHNVQEDNPRELSRRLRQFWSDC